MNTNRGFTLVELLTVIAIIGVLASLILMTSGYVQKKGAKARAEGEIKAFTTGLERYKADNAIYPRDKSLPGQSTTHTKSLDPRVHGNASAANYKNASLVLYKALSGDTNADGKLTAADNPGSTDLPMKYHEFDPKTLGKASTAANAAITYLQDPFGYSYGYSTAQGEQIESGTPNPPTAGYNPTFDLWCTGGNTAAPTPGTPTDVTLQWITNW